MQVFDPEAKFQLVMHGIQSYTFTPGASFSFSINHNLGYRPIAIVDLVNIRPTDQAVRARAKLPGDMGSYNFVFGAAKLPNWCYYTVSKTKINIFFKASLPGVTDQTNFDNFHNPLYFEYLLFNKDVQ